MKSMKFIKSAIETGFFIGYSMLLLTAGWIAHEKLSPVLSAMQQVQDIQSKLPKLLGTDK
jgi:hypothetical protein